MEPHILAIDQGTTGTTALIMNSKAEIVARHTQEFAQYFPKPGWVEHDLDEIWESLRVSIDLVFEKSRIPKKAIATIGITNQRETTCVWEKTPRAKPLHPAIVWQDGRTADFCARLKKKGLGPWVRRKTGLALDPYFSATKLHWILKENSRLRVRAKKGEIAFGTIDSYLIYRMTGKSHVTDVSNASRTLLMNLKTRMWDRELLGLFKIPPSMLPGILPSCVEYGKCKDFFDLPDGTPIHGVAGDQQAALFGQACFKPGMSKVTYGTGAFALSNLGSQAVLSKAKLLTSVAWEIGNTPTYCLEGSTFIAGAAVQWLRDGLKIIESSSEVEALSQQSNPQSEVIFVPALAGLSAPHWKSEARGTLFGLTRGTTRADMARATLEGIGFQVEELLAAMRKDYGKKMRLLRVDGGASVNDRLMQFQCDLAGVLLQRPQVVETTSWGVGLQAGLGAGVWTSLKEIEGFWKEEKTFKPVMKKNERDKKLRQWGKAVRLVKMMAEN